MKALIIITILLSSLALADHRGGNGGHPFEIALKNRLLRVARFIMENPKDFGKLSETNWYLIAENVSIEITDEILKDKFNATKCATNFPKKNLIKFNKSCFLNHQQETRTLNSLLAHELFNLRGIELPRRGRSVYTYSSKFLTIDRSLSVNTSSLSFLSSKCTLANEVYGQLSKVSQAIIELKGFRPVATSQRPEFELMLKPANSELITLRRKVWSDNVLIKDELAWKRELSMEPEENLIELPLCILL